MWRQETGVNVSKRNGFGGMEAKLVRGSGMDTDLVRGSGRSVLRQESETGVSVLKQLVLMRLKCNRWGQSQLFESSAQSNK